MKKWSYHNSEKSVESLSKGLIRFLTILVLLDFVYILVWFDRFYKLDYFLFGIVLMNVLVLAFIHLVIRKDEAEEHQDQRTLSKIMSYQTQREVYEAKLVSESISRFTAFKREIEVDRFYERFSPEYTRFTPDSLPKDYDLEALDEIDLTDFLEFRRETSNEQSISINYWTKRLRSASNSINYQVDFPGIKHISIGFYDTANRNDWKNADSFHFGIILYLDLLSDLSKRPQALAHWLRYEGRLGASVLRSLQVDRFEFPVFFRSVRELQHCADPQPLLGTKACVAEPSLPDQELGLGFLTAKHVTGSLVQTPVQLDCGHVGYVADVGKEGIDASFVICTKCKLTKGRNISTRKTVGAWTEVDIITKSRIIPTMITDTTDRKGIYIYHQLPVHIFLADMGERDDSGSLIVDRKTGEALGMCLGGLTDLAGQSGGYGLHAYQISQLMGLNFYEKQ